LCHGDQLLERFVTEVTLAYLEREGVQPERAIDLLDASPDRDVEVLRQRLEAVAVDYAEDMVTQSSCTRRPARCGPRIVELEAGLAGAARSGPCPW
jgi:hypothetical protein